MVAPDFLIKIFSFLGNPSKIWSKTRTFLGEELTWDNNSFNPELAQEYSLFLQHLVRRLKMHFTVKVKLKILALKGEGLKHARPASSSKISLLTPLLCQYVRLTNHGIGIIGVIIASLHIRIVFNFSILRISYPVVSLSWVLPGRMFNHNHVSLSTTGAWCPLSNPRGWS